MTDEQQFKADMQELVRLAAFQRFLWRVIQTAGIFARTTDGSDGRNLAYDEGRRNLGLDILDMAEIGQPAEHPEKYPLLTLMQVFREEAQKPKEKPNGRYNRNAELDEPDPA